MSLLAKARGVERGFPQFVFDIFTQYDAGGPDYIHSLLTGYDQTPPAGMVIPEGTHYNPYFMSGVSLKMPKPLSDGQVTYDDGAPQTVDQYSRDVAAFLMWAAEPHMEQRGLKVYKEVCSACHSMNLVAFRTLEQALAIREAQIKSLAAEYTIHDGPNDAGDMFDRPGKPSDHFPAPFANEEAAAASNGGAAPPDMSLLAKARGVERGFPQFVFDIFTQYDAGGPDYIHSLLTGYDQTPPAGMVIPEGTHYNPYFMSGVSLKMPKPLSDGQVTYDDGSPQTIDQYARDVSAFLMWAAEPHMEDRKKTGFRVLVFLLLFGALVYLTKRKVWEGVAH